MNTNSTKNANDRLCRFRRWCRFVLMSLAAVAVTSAAAAGRADSVYIVTGEDGDGAVVLEAYQEETPELDEKLISVSNGNRGYDLLLEEDTNVTIRHEGAVLTASSRQESVTSLLNRLKVSPGPLEAVGVKVSDTGIELNVASELVYYDHVREKAIYETVRRPNPDMDEGEERVVQTGANGTRTSVYEVVWSNGEEISRQFVEELASTAVDQIVEYGTGETAAKIAAAQAEAAAKAAAAEAAAKAAASTTPSVGGSAAKPAAASGKTSRSGVASASENADGSGTLKLKDGTTLNYSGVRKMTATAYTSGVNGVGTRTASGTKVHVGTVAVDRSVIPLGTRMYIVADGGIVYGLAVAEDTGVRGKKVDLYFNSYQECIQFGVRNCTVYILE